VNAIVLTPDLTGIVPFNESVSNPRTRTNIGTRFDYQVSKNNTLTARYQFYRDTQNNAGIGGFSLASTGCNANSTEHSVQISDSQILGTKAVNEIRFQYNRDNSHQTPLNTSPTINVIGAFLTAEEAAAGRSLNHTDHYELQNYTSLHGVHTFSNSEAACASRMRSTYLGRASMAALLSRQFRSIRARSRFSLAELQTAPGASQFTLNASPTGGIPTVSATVVDAGLYLQDEWRIREPHAHYGLRFETQNAIHEHGDWGPRVAIAWGIDGNSRPLRKLCSAQATDFLRRFGESSVVNANPWMA